MRMALLAIVLGCGAAGSAAAQTAFAPATALDNQPIAQALQREAFANGAPVRWSTGELKLSPNDSVRVSVGGVLATPGGLPLNLDRSEFQARDYEVSVIRNWPSAVSFEAGRVGVELSPHAGVGVTSRGGSAEAGAELRLQSRDDKAAAKLKSMGVKDGASFGDQGRWYLFAAASGRAVGLNMLRSDTGWDRAGWTTDPTSSLIGDAQVGVGWRKGAVQTSFGFIHREVKGSHMIFGQETKDDSLVAFSLSIRPRK
jgi:hypothetical protein